MSLKCVRFFYFPTVNLSVPKSSGKSLFVEIVQWMQVMEYTIGRKCKK